MASKAEFYVALDHVKEAATNALKAMPEAMQGRERKLWQGMLSRLPNQIDDLRTNLDDPHTVTDPSTRQNRIIDPF
jgi:hypothetical protein